MSNNKNRVALVQLAATPPVEAPHSLVQLEFIVPTEMVDLPSKGLFYPEGHPLI